MPRCTYKCNKCNENFQVWHGMKEMQESCQFCDEVNCLTRIPQRLYVSRVIVEDEKVGRVTEEYIDQNRELLSEMKKEARGQVYED